MNRFTDIKDDSLYKALMIIREAPELWLKVKSLKILDTYIYGIILGKSDMRRPFYYCEWFEKFTEYVVDVCVEGSGCYGIVSAIYEDGYNDENGFDRFYELLDNFCNEKYPDRESGCLLSESEKPVKGEIRAVKIGCDAIYELALKYISDNFNEIFDLEEDESFKISTEKSLFVQDIDKENLMIVHYDSKDIKYGMRVEDMIKDVDISAKTLLYDKPYTVIKTAK